MNCRRHGSKPTIALWMLVAVADLALLAAAAGPVLALLAMAGLITVAGAVVGTRMITRRDAAETEVVARRRA
jgi:hypothetical protein